MSLLFENKIKEKNISLLKEIDSNLPKLQADRFKLEQVLINLIDNAIKYTDIGTVKLKAYFDKKFYLEVSDSGRGIPQKHLDRLFERFYVVDKSRSRKLGGSGLGLSIVKHIVQLHNGEIKVTSEIGKGTVFTVILPLEY
jgi:two-component system phosphate regulon sensor histidine kinase PhoR